MRVSDYRSTYDHAETLRRIERSVYPVPPGGTTPPAYITPEQAMLIVGQVRGLLAGAVPEREEEEAET